DGEDGRRAAHAESLAERELLGHRSGAAWRCAHLLAAFRLRDRSLTILRAPNRLHFAPVRRTGFAGARKGQVTHTNAKLHQLVDLAVQPPAISAVDIGEN